MIRLRFGPNLLFPIPFPNPPSLPPSFSSVDTARLPPFITTKQHGSRLARLKAGLATNEGAAAGNIASEHLLETSRSRDTRIKVTCASRQLPVTRCKRIATASSCWLFHVLGWGWLSGTCACVRLINVSLSHGLSPAALQHTFVSENNFHRGTCNFKGRSL